MNHISPNNLIIMNTQVDSTHFFFPVQDKRITNFITRKEIFGIRLNI